MRAGVDTRMTSNAPLRKNYRVRIIRSIRIKPFEIFL
jgi:hypothetical protein